MAGQSLEEWAGGRRRVLVIVFDDIVDSTRMGRVIGDEAMLHLIQRHLERTNKIVAHLDGYFIKWRGDGSLVVFRSTSAALEFVLQLRSEPVSPQVRIRAGIHIGEVDIRSDDIHGNDIHGDAVNVTSRVENYTSSDDIWVSEEAYRALLPGETLARFGISWEREVDAHFRGIKEPQVLWQCIPYEDPEKWTRAEKIRRGWKVFKKKIRYWEIMLLMPGIGIFNEQIFDAITSFLLFLKSLKIVNFTPAGFTHLQVEIAGLIVLTSVLFSFGTYGFYRGFRDRKMYLKPLWGGTILGYMATICVLTLLRGEFIYASNYQQFLEAWNISPAGSKALMVTVILGVVFAGLFSVSLYICVWGAIGAWYRRSIVDR